MTAAQGSASGVAVRPPAVAGAFYPADARALAAEVDRLLAAAAVPAEAPVPKAIIAPHAGYVYSGPVAASVYAWLKPARGAITRVVLLGPAHRVGFRGLALAGATAFRTPLGDIPVDTQAADRIRDLPQVVELPQAHAAEHSLEVHLPFLQRSLSDFRLVPLVVGEAGPDEVAEVLERLWGGPETLIVISSDLSHYLDYAAARARDARTADAIERLDAGALGYDDACGRNPIRGLLKVAAARNLMCLRTDLRNSGDTAGPRDRVVGYGAWAFAPAATAGLNPRQRDKLLEVAARSIRHGLAKGTRPEVAIESFEPGLRRQAASFVTLKREGRLRGCIGSLAAHQPLCADVAWNAWSSAFADPRFDKLQTVEFRALSVSISVLSAPEPLPVRDEADLLAQLRPGIDGLILMEGTKRATFLPQVWDELTEASAFLAQLKRKAGLPAGYWSASLSFQRYGSESFGAPVAAIL